MVEQVQNWEKNVSPVMTVVYPGKEITVSDAFLSSTELFPFLDLHSEGLSSLATLGRQLSFFSTISESKKFSLGKKSSSSSVFLPRTHVCHHGGIYIIYGRGLYIPSILAIALNIYYH